MWSNWAYPTLVESNSSNAILTFEQVESWREKGFALVDGLLSKELCDQVSKESYEKLSTLGDNCDFGSDGLLEFPCGLDASDQVTLHPNILSAAAQLLNIPIKDLRLTQSDIWLKRGKEIVSDDPNSNNSQRVHCDYGNHTLVHPPAWYSPEVVAMIVYYDDVELVGGATALVPREGESDPAYKWPLIAMPGIGGIHYMNDRNTCEKWMENNKPEMYEFRKKLYEREVPVKFSRGTVLLYRHDVFHRGTPVKANKYRIVQNLVYRRADVEWITTWNQGFARSMYGDGQKFTIEHIIGKSSPEQRCVLGFPAPGHRYWNRITLNAVCARFEIFGFDKKPYEQALNEAENNSHLINQ